MRFITTVIILIVGALLCYKSLVQYPQDSRLEEVYSKILSIKEDNINNGGCGLFALHLSTYLDTLGVKYEIIRIDDRVERIPNHVMLKVYDGDNVAYVDHSGFYKPLYMDFFGSDRSFITKDSLKTLVYLPGWNKKFNRDDTTSIIKQLWQ